MKRVCVFFGEKGGVRLEEGARRVDARGFSGEDGI